MGKRVSALLALVMLAGCGVSPAPAGPEIPPEEPPAVSLPEFRQPEPISAPAVVTKGREPAGESQLPPAEAERQEYRQNMERWASGGGMELLAEAAGAAFYALPLYADSSGQTALIRWGDSRAEFDWVFCPGPSIVLPWMNCLDIDGDGEEELAVVCQTGTGTGVSLQELHILEKAPDGTLTDYAFPESLWRERLPALFATASIHGRTFAVLGHELVEFEEEHLDLSTASSGLIAGFSPEGEGGLRFQGAFALCHEGGAVPCYVAKTSAQLLYQDGVFTLRDYHLFGYGQ